MKSINNLVPGAWVHIVWGDSCIDYMRVERLDKIEGLFVSGSIDYLARKTSKAIKIYRNYGSFSLSGNTVWRLMTAEEIERISSYFLADAPPITVDSIYEIY